MADLSMFTTRGFRHVGGGAGGEKLPDENTTYRTYTTENPAD